MDYFGWEVGRGTLYPQTKPVAEAYEETARARVPQSPDENSLSLELENKFNNALRGKKTPQRTISVLPM